MLGSRFKSLLFALSIVVVGACGGGGITLPGIASSTVSGGALAGAADGPAATATFNNPVNVVHDTDGSLYVCDFDNNRVRKIKGGTVTTLVNTAGFQRPFGIAIAPNGNLYVSTDDDDTGAHSGTTGTIWRVDKTTGVPTVVARNIGRPRGLAVLSDNVIVASDVNRHIVSLVDPNTGVVTPIAGQDGVAGLNDGSGATARFSRPYGCCVLPGDEILVADQTNNMIRKVTRAGVVTTYVGTGAPGRIDGPFLTATLNGPHAIARNPVNGDLYVADTVGKVVRKLSGGTVKWYAGSGFPGYAEGPDISSQFYGLEGIGVSHDGKTLYIADGNGGDGSNYNRVRSVRL